MVTLSIPAYFYPQRDGACLTGEARRAPLDLPVSEVSRETHGKGRNKVTRVLVQSAAPQGWGEWSGRAWFAYVDADVVRK